MIELLDTSLDVQVSPAEYARLLGYPRGHLLEGRAAELAHWARNWYAQHGQPWVYARQAQSMQIKGDWIVIEDTRFFSPRLHQQLTDADAHSVMLVAVSAGPDAEAEAQRLWQEEKPDEYLFLEVFASAVVEHLIASVGMRLCNLFQRQGIAVLPHYSPGYQQWDIAQQPKLLKVLAPGQKIPALPSTIEALESGMLRPKKSLLAVFGLTKQLHRVKPFTDLTPCQNCSLARCQYRRAPTGVKASPQGWRSLYETAASGSQ